MSTKIQPQSDVIASDEVVRGQMPTLHFLFIFSLHESQRRVNPDLVGVKLGYQGQ